jgi:hypothetical protein
MAVEGLELIAVKMFIIWFGLLFVVQSYINWWAESIRH